MNTNLFPCIGTSRIWTESFIQEKISRLPELSWRLAGKLVTANIEVLPDCPGVYLFVRKSLLDTISPFSEPSYPAIIYVGQARNIRGRLTDYIRDKSAVRNHATSTRKIRDLIKIMFNEYGDGLDVFYSVCNPKDLTITEDTLIKILDPAFNSGQKLNEDDFARYERVINARLGEVVEAYPTEDEQQDQFEKTVDMRYGLGNPEPAF